MRRYPAASAPLITPMADGSWAAQTTMSTHQKTSTTVRRVPARRAGKAKAASLCVTTSTFDWQTGIHPLILHDADEHAGRPRVLIVEDDESVRHLAKMILEQNGFAADACANGSEALALVEAGPIGYDVIILGMRAPRMGGRETLLRIQELNARIPVILASGNGNARKLQDCLDLGAKGVLSTPFLATDLLRLVTDALASSLR